MGNPCGNMFIFGSCAASQLTMGLLKLREKGKVPPDTRIGYWAMPADAYTLPENYIYNGNHVILRKQPSVTAPAGDIFHPGLNEDMDSWMYLPNEIWLPFEDDFNYIFASPIFPFSSYVTLMKEFNLWQPSQNMVKDIILNTIAPMMIFINFLKNFDISISIVEGPRLFNFDVDIDIYNYITNMYVNITRNEIKKIGIEILELDENLFLDDHGFTKSKFKNSRFPQSDFIHANSLYGDMIASLLMNSLN